MHEIDWLAEWQKHAHRFQDGFAHIDLFGLDLKLAPGAGFGDCSHPTTLLVLEMMRPHVIQKRVLDIGCGSGILSLAAKAFGAKSTYGLDIDPEAIKHARQNACLNGYTKNCHFGHSCPTSIDIILMNMIRLEQKEAYVALPSLKAQTAITSGILQQERQKYLKQTSSWGWELKEEKQSNGWLGFRFTLPAVSFSQWETGFAR